MSKYLLILISITYMGFLFFLAFYAEKLKKNGKSITNFSLIYSLSLAIFCSAWTFFGSVGRVATTGIEFLAIYIGPTLIMLLGCGMLLKIIRISKLYGITSIADFIAARYGKFQWLGIWVTLISLLAGIPYIALQIKALSLSIEAITSQPSGAIFYQDSTFLLILILIGFSFLFGTRKIENNEKHEGLLLAISAESIFKLIAFIVVGIYVVYELNDGFSSLFELAFQNKTIRQAFDFELTIGYGNWTIYMIISGFAFLLLPRQFQMAVVENQNEKHLKRAIWLLPLYLLLINIFVIPIALAGINTFGAALVNPDTYVLLLPLQNNAKFISLIAYLGGFSAATGMIIVETIAISTMLTNSFTLPILLENELFKSKFTYKLPKIALWLRRFFIALIVFLAYWYFKTISDFFTLVSIGMTAFVAIVQFAPSVIGGIYWKKGNQNGAINGLLLGVIIWIFTLIIPSIFANSTGEISYVFKPIFEFFSPFKINGFDSISNAAFWSLLVNTLFYVGVSINTQASPAEKKQALLFVDVFELAENQSQPQTWRGTARIQTMTDLLASFLGRKTALETIKTYCAENEITLNSEDANPMLVGFVENQISSMIGSSSARLLMSSITNEDFITADEIMQLLKNSEKILEDNEELIKKTNQLQNLSNQLAEANDSLHHAENLRKEFLSTVTHEIRTPLTSVKALTEIIHDNADLDPEERQHFLDTIINETDRLTRLVNQVLDLEKYESGKHVLNAQIIQTDRFMNGVYLRMNEIAKEKNVVFIKKLNNCPPFFKADEDKLTQLLINLISNALKFVKPHFGIVTLTLKKTGSSIQFNVEDNGIGIVKEAQNKIFDRFFQADNQAGITEKGSGLGLSIAKKIVEIHGGRINLKSEPNKGTNFTILIPN
jgi:Na+/proline symporter/nitrogen-specific signal transduction histidine kinase